MVKKATNETGQLAEILPAVGTSIGTALCAADQLITCSGASKVEAQQPDEELNLHELLKTRTELSQPLHYQKKQVGAVDGPTAAKHVNAANGPTVSDWLYLGQNGLLSPDFL